MALSLYNTLLVKLGAQVSVFTAKEGLESHLPPTVSTISQCTPILAEASTAISNTQPQHTAQILTLLYPPSPMRDQRSRVPEPRQFLPSEVFLVHTASLCTHVSLSVVNYCPPGTRDPGILFVEIYVCIGVDGNSRETETETVCIAVCAGTYMQVYMYAHVY